MKKQPTSLLIFVLFILPIISGCITDGANGGSDTNSGGANISATEYVPLKNGTIYHYTKTKLSPYSSNASLEYYHIAISGDVQYYGKTYRRMFEKYQDYSDTTLVRISENTLYMLGSFWHLSAKRAHTAAHPMQVLTEFTEVPYLRFNAQEWTLYTGSSSGNNHTLTLTWTGVYRGIQSVTVPAGTFNHCVMFELVMREDGEYTSFDPPLTTTTVTSVTLWYAKGIGLVKTLETTEQSTNGDDLVLSEISTSELTSYDIP